MPVVLLWGISTMFSLEAVAKRYWLSSTTNESEGGRPRAASIMVGSACLEAREELLQNVVEYQCWISSWLALYSAHPAPVRSGLS